MGAGSGPHLGAVVYLWGEAEQDRLVVDCLAPAARAFRPAGEAGFWFNRFDARGPHVFALYPDVAAGGGIDEPSRLLGEAIAGWLRAAPPRSVLTEAELRERHDACRGKTLCAPDDEPGLARPGEVRLFAHPSDGYPLALGRGLARPAALWAAVGGLTAWSVETLREEPRPRTAAAALWLAALDRSLPGRLAPEAYWRHHASTLLPRLAEQLDESGRLPALARLVGERNRSILDRLWEPPAALAAAGAAAPAGAIEDLLAATQGLPPAERRALVREVAHFSLKQLGVPVKLQIPIVLYAWSRHAAAGFG